MPTIPGELFPLPYSQRAIALSLGCRGIRGVAAVASQLGQLGCAVPGGVGRDRGSLFRPAHSAQLPPSTPSEAHRNSYTLVTLLALTAEYLGGRCVPRAVARAWCCCALKVFGAQSAQGWWQPGCA